VILKDRFKGENTQKSSKYSLKMLFKFFLKKTKKVGNGVDLPRLGKFPQFLLLIIFEALPF